MSVVKTFDNLTSEELKEAILRYEQMADKSKFDEVFSDYLAQMTCLSSTFKRQIQQAILVKSKLERRSEVVLPELPDLPQLSALSTDDFMPDQPRPLYNNDTELKYEDTLIVGDVELPGVSMYWLFAIFLIGQQHEINRLIINGDWIASDNRGVSSHAPIYASSGENSYRQDLGWGKKILLKWHEVFGEIVATIGNHDDMIARKTEGQYHPSDWYPDLDFYRTTGIHAHLYMQMPDDTYLLVYHPRNYSQNVTNLLHRQYAVQNYKGEKVHIVANHTHQTAKTKSRDGLRELVALGTIREKRFTQYVNTAPRPFTEWTSSIGLIKNGVIHVIEEENMEDWLSPVNLALLKQLTQEAEEREDRMRQQLRIK